MAGLEIQIGADNSDLNKKIKEAELNLKELSNIKLEQIKLGLDTKEINGNIASVKKSLTELKTVSKDTGNAISGMAPKVANGGNALMQFSRIAQDAPFGIMGIGNNITATAESFGHLVKETGSAGAALKSVASSMLGTGGILLSVSLVTTGLTYMAQNGITVGDVFNKLTGTFDGTTKAMSDLNVEAAKNAQGDISKMNAYVSVAKDVNLSMSDRLIAVKKLQDEYPAYFGNLTKEQILNGNVAAAVKGVTDALIAKAKAAAAVGKIVELAEKEEVLQEKINSSIAQTAKFYQLKGKAAKDFATVLNKQLRGEIDLLAELDKGNANNLSTSEKQALAAIQYSVTLQDLGADLRENIALQDKYTKKINENTAAQIKLETAAPKAGKKQKTFSTPQVIGIKSEIDSSGLVDLSGQVVQIAKNVQGAEGVITTSMGNIKVAFDSATIDMLETLYRFNEEAKSIITGSLTSTFNNLGTAIGEALASGKNVFQAMGNSLLASLGQFISEMGGLLIKYGVLAVAKGVLDKAIAIPGAGIIAGTAAIAVGVALKGAGAAIGNKASGKNSSVSGNTGGSYSSPASSSSYSSSGGGSFGGGTVVFEIEGSKLVGVLNNTLDKNKRLGGN